MAAPEFVLKVTPPRPPRAAIQRAWLQRLGDEGRERTAMTVIAPAGFGKTTLLVQWRRHWMEEGVVVAWFRAHETDDAARFTTGLVHAMHVASGRAAFDSLGTQFAGDPGGDVEALTELLGEIAHMGKPTMMMIDDAERLPEDTAQQSLRYLLDNAPPNFHIVIASRVPVPTEILRELRAKGEVLAVDTNDLRFTLEESTALLRQRLGQRLPLDDCAKLHDLTGGWPLGLQLVASTIEREPDIAAAFHAVSARHGDIEAFFLDALVSRLPPEMTEFLVRTSILEHLEAASCKAVTGDPGAQEMLDRLQTETPIMMPAGREGALQVHQLARDFLLGRFERLPREEQAALHARAAQWFAGQERFHEAAMHAFAMGDTAQAHAFAARALLTLTLEGKVLEARGWLDRIPRAIVDDDVNIRVAAAWVLSIGPGNAEALKTTMTELEDPALPAHLGFIAARAAGAASVYGDRIGLLPGILETWEHSHWKVTIPVDEPQQTIAMSNARAVIAFNAGHMQATREELAGLPPEIEHKVAPMPMGNRTMLDSLSHLIEGDARLAEDILTPALVIVERTEGRRSLLACVYASVLAAALLERDRPADAETLLAYRLDVIDHVGLPDNILIAYRTLVYVALADNDEHRALLVLQSLSTLAQARQIPRLSVYALAERIRIHALAERIETAEVQLRELDDLASAFDVPALAVFKPRVALANAIAHAYVSIARRDFKQANAHLDAAERLALQTGRRRDGMAVMVLRAVAAGLPDGAQLLTEALSLAALGGCDRLLADTHPLAVRMRADMARNSETPVATHPMPHRAPGRRTHLSAPHGGLLTLKEAEILALIDKGMANKVIARTMGISPETVKWHVKNLSQKLAAGTRQHAVDRARMLGLLAH
jgi:LuxR family maltose regulon positive regulatory protein